MDCVENAGCAFHDYKSLRDHLQREMVPCIGLCVGVTRTDVGHHHAPRVEHLKVRTSAMESFLPWIVPNTHADDSGSRNAVDAADVDDLYLIVD